MTSLLTSSTDGLCENAVCNVNTNPPTVSSSSANDDSVANSDDTVIDSTNVVIVNNCCFANEVIESIDSVAEVLDFEDEEVAAVTASGRNGVAGRTGSLGSAFSGFSSGPEGACDETCLAYRAPWATPPTATIESNRLGPRASANHESASIGSANQQSGNKIERGAIDPFVAAITSPPLSLHLSENEFICVQPDDLDDNFPRIFGGSIGTNSVNGAGAVTCAGHCAGGNAAGGGGAHSVSGAGSKHSSWETTRSASYNQTSTFFLKVFQGY